MLLPLRSVAALDLSKNELLARRVPRALSQVARSLLAQLSGRSSYPAPSNSPCLKTSSRHRKEESNRIPQFYKGVDTLDDFDLLVYLEVSNKIWTIFALVALLLWIF